MTPSPVEIQYYIKKAQQSRLTQSEVDGLVTVAQMYLDQQATVARINGMIAIALEAKGGWEATVRKIARILGDGNADEERGGGVGVDEITVHH